MSFIRNRVALALIGLLLIGGISAAVAVLTTPQPLRAALVGAGQANANPTATSAATATTAPSGGTTTSSSSSGNTATTAPTTPPSASTNPPAASGQVTDVAGAIVSVNVSAGTFVMTVNGSSLTVVVNGSTNFSGDAKNLSQLQSAKSAEVHGVMQANGSLLATEVNADTGAGG